MPLDTLEAQLIGGGDSKPLSGRQFLAALRILRALFDNSEARFQAATDARTQLLDILNAQRDRLAAIEANNAARDDRVSAIETALPKAVTITVLANPAGLPAAATPRQWFRVQGDPGVYVGNGAGQPLTKLIPVAL